MRLFAFRVPVPLLLLGLFGGFVAPLIAQLSATVKIKSKFVQIAGAPGADKDVETWIHEFVLENGGRDDLKNLTMKLRSYTFGEYDVDGTSEEDLTFNEETFAISEIKRNEETEIKSREMVLATSARVRARDMIEGVWVRVFDSNGKEVGTLVSPSNLSRKVKWED